MRPTNQRYQIQAELGRGGMGVVYKARDRMLGRTVALKRLLADDSRNLIERFLSEAKSIAALNHPNIIQIYDIGKDENGLFITTEYVEGTDLYKLLVMRKKLPPDFAVKLIIPVCKALAFAHERGVIHRDIKPANILLTQDGIPKVADFGLARLETDKDMENTGVIMGTRSYSSPEQLSDSKHVDHRTDIFSIGALFFEMLTGKNPRFLRESQTPPEFRQLIQRATEPSPEKRYPNLKNFLVDLARITHQRDEGITENETEHSTTIVSGEMVLVPKGPFLFGPEKQKVDLPGFLIDVYPVTNAQFAEFYPSHIYPPDQDDHPATKLTWIQAEAYARSKGKRLPTEQEWEKAARSFDGRRFPWGNSFSPGFCNCFESSIGSTTPVNAYPEGQSPYGVMDMAGNVWEWTQTYLDERKTARILKGGAFNGESKFAFCFARFAYPEKGLLPTAGFRCVKDKR